MSRRNLTEDILRSLQLINSVLGSAPWGFFLVLYNAKEALPQPFVKNISENKIAPLFALAERGGGVSTCN